MASIKELGNGKYRVHVSDGFLQNGKVNRMSKNITAKSLADARKQANAIEVDFKRGAIAPAGGVTTFRDLVNVWRKLDSARITDRCCEEWDYLLDNFILPEFGRMKISDIQPMHITRYLTFLKEGVKRKDGKLGGYSDQTIRHHYTVLNKMFNFGATNTLVQKNPISKLSKTEKPSVGKTQIDYYTNEEMKHLFSILEEDIKQIEKNLDKDMTQGVWTRDLTALERYAIHRFEKHMYNLFCRLGYWTGFRRCELLGVDFDDFDYINMTVRVYEGVHYSKKNGVYTRNGLKKKTEKFREIHITEKCMQLIRDYKNIMDETRAIMGDKWIPCDRLFIAVNGGTRTQAGGPMNPTTATQWMGRFIKKHKLKHLTVHGLRHSCASYLLNKGVPLKAVADWLGDTMEVIEKTYGHTYTHTAQQAATYFDE